MHTWTKDEIITGLKQLFQKGEKMTIANIGSQNCALMRAAQTHFSSWNKALIASDIPTVFEMEKNKVLIADAKKPTWLLGYVTGVLCGDASLEGQNGIFGLNTTAKEFAQVFADALYQWSYLKPYWREYDRKCKHFGDRIFHYYYTGIQAKEVYTFFQTIGQFGTYD